MRFVDIRGCLSALLLLASLATSAKVLPETLMLAQTQFYPWREQARGYLGRYLDQPLLVDPDLPWDADGGEVDYLGGWSRYLSQADCRRTVELERSYGLDGTCAFAGRDSRFFAAGTNVPNFVAVPIVGYPKDKGKIWKKKLWPAIEKALGNPCNYVHDGKILLVGYNTDEKITPADFVKTRDAIRAKYGDRFLFCVTVSRLLRWRHSFAENDGLTDADKAEMAEYVRSWARVADGVSLSATSVCTRREKSERIANVPFFEAAWSVMRSVLDEPEFKGGKLLGLASIKGHMNAYMKGYNCLEDCTRTLRSYFDLALGFDPDYIQIPEWDEYNENTLIMPSLYSSYTYRRIIRYYSAKFKKRPLEPIAGDDLAKPNLIVSYRKCLSPGERLTVEVLNVPDGARQGPLTVAVELADEHGTTIARLEPKTLDEAIIGEARWELDSAALAAKARAPRVVLTWTKDGKRATVADGLHPIDLAPANTWNHLAVKQPIRDLVQLTRADFAMVGSRVKVAFASPEPIRYAMLCGNGCIQYVQGKAGADEDRFREDETHAVFQISPVAVGRHRLKPGEKPYAYAVPGVPEAAWYYLGKVTKGETFTCDDINEHASPSVYLRLPKAKLAEARLMVEYAQLGFKGEIPLQAAFDRLAYSVGASKKAMQVTVARFRRQARYPSVANANEVSFEVEADADRATMMYHAQLVTMSGKVWYSRPVVREAAEPKAEMRLWNAMIERAETLSLPAARIPEMAWDLSPAAGNVMTVGSGERHWFGLLGGPYSSANLWNRGARTEGAVDKPCAEFLDTRDDSLPKRVQEPDGSWSLVFDGEDDFANVPCEAWPTFGGCTLEMDVMPASDFSHRGSLWANFFGLFDLGVEADGRLSAAFWQTEVPKPTYGAKLACDRWTHVKLVNDAERIAVWQDGVKTIEFPIRMPALNTMGAMIGGFPVRGRGFFKGKVRNIRMSQRTKSLKVLMIGNSFTASVLRETPAFAKAAGVTLDVVQCGIGGCPLDKHWANVEKVSDPAFRPYGVSWSYASDPKRTFPKKANVTEMLVADTWDIVTIQQASGKSAFYESYEPYADKLIAKIRGLAPQAEIVIQETWSYVPYSPRLTQWKMDPASMHAALKAAYAQLAKKHGLRVIPTGDAVQLFRERLPVDYGKLLTREEIAALANPATVDFHGDVVGASAWKQGRKGKQEDWEQVKLRNDWHHFNARGNYLQACVWTAALFGIDPTLVGYRPDDLSEADARLMRECARDAVKAW